MKSRSSFGHGRQNSYIFVALLAIFSSSFMGINQAQAREKSSTPDAPSAITVKLTLVQPTLKAGSSVATALAAADPLCYLNIDTTHIRSTITPISVGNHAWVQCTFDVTSITINDSLFKQTFLGIDSYQAGASTFTAGPTNYAKNFNLYKNCTNTIATTWWATADSSLQYAGNIWTANIINSPVVLNCGT